MVTSRRLRRDPSLTLVRWAGLVAAFLVTAVLGSISGVLYAYADDLPQISALDDYRPSTITQILALDGRVVDEFATQRRVVIGYDDVAPALRAAIIATEDAGFNQHFGLSASRILVTALRDLFTGERAGASTLTQQLARNLFPIGREKTAERKIKEALLALQIEKRYTKREIFTFYINQIYFGHGAYGVEAASRLYFDRSAKDLAIDEAATIAAIVQAPGRVTPFLDPTRTVQRRNLVLRRMAAEGYVPDDVAAAAADGPLVVRGQPTPERSLAPYFVEDIRKDLEQHHGATALYEGGLIVQTTLDIELQAVANTAVDRGLRRLDKRRSGYRPPTRNVVADGETIDAFMAPRWRRPIVEGDIVPAIVVGLQGPAARIRIRDTVLVLPPTAFAWTGRRSVDQLFTPGDVIEVQVSKMTDGVPAAALLEQPPIVEGSLIAIDNRTGQIRAMVGGFSYERSQFNRATQARRQMGSTFKPIVYTAAIDRGFTPVSTLVDEPVSFDVGPDQPPYEPQNYDREYAGSVTLRRALEDSRNVPAVKLVNELGPATIVEYAKRFGFSRPMEPYLSLALGAPESTLVELTSAYSTFPNHGVRMTPYAIVSVSDREGNLLEEHSPRSNETIRADTAFVITNLLRGVVDRGTAHAAAALDWPLAGKTGTMDEYTDAWFVGFDPNISVGVWVGYDERASLGRGETGASAALPIWTEFMRGFIAAEGDRENPPRFDAPGNIVFVPLDSGITEAFINGTQPATAFSILE